ncbi:MAG TPA: DUF2933 domain-containing protein [Bacillota bacterium]
MKNKQWLVLGLCAVGAIGLFAALTGRLGGNIGWLLILLCPLSHIFMMGGHGHQHQQSTTPAPAEDEEKDRSTPAARGQSCH